jgi:uncharacterized protein
MHESQTELTVGRVVGLWRYPVKSMCGEKLAECEVGWHGFAGDRRWAFVRNGMDQSGFPWLTLRERENMNHYRPTFLDASVPDQSRTLVRTPSGETFDIADPLLAQELCASGARVIRQDRGIFDTFPLSLISTQTIQWLGKEVGVELDLLRFRPNIVVEAIGCAPFQEDDWVGAILRVGGMRLRVDKRDGRCAVITIDPTTTERNPSILRKVAAERQGCLGAYGTTVQPGRVSLHDCVIIDSRPG